ncbi:hypothetical protein MAIT1_04503 [Magnetofaba australis IT-1]|uniref:Uncharacterized protein n=2 Tax=Magnetofaba TaxID=1472292 RepID=A0A1Y2K9B7_9PROT|nr:hypothetical protein MAIT1_04503 [Magnetofaba australis IT-1]
MGFVHGVFLMTPIWLNSVINGQLMARVVECPPWVPKFLYEVNSFSLISHAYAALFALGAPEWPVSILSSGLFTALMFFSTAVAGLLILRNVWIALLLPLALVDLHILPDHYYHIEFPLDSSNYGIIGMHLTLYITSLLAMRKYGWGLFLLGILPAIHASWAIAAWGMAAALCLYQRVNPFKLRELRYFFLGVGVFLADMAIHHFFVRHPLPPLDPAQTQGAWESFMRDYGRQKHHKLISSEPRLLWGFWNFFVAEAVFLAMIGAAWLRRGAQLTPAARNLLKTIMTLMAASFVVRMMLEFALESTPPFLEMLLTGRWLNLDVTLGYALIFGWSMQLAVAERNRLGLAAFALAVLINLASWLYPGGLALMPCHGCEAFGGNKLAYLGFELSVWVMVLALLAALWGVGKPGEAAAPTPRWRARLPEALVAILALTYVGSAAAQLTQIRQVFDRQEYYVKNAFVPAQCDGWQGFIDKHIVHGEGAILAAPAELYDTKISIGIMWANHRCQVTPPLLGELYSVDSILSAQQGNVDLACALDANTPTEGLQEGLKACWEGKSAAQWNAISAKLGITQILAPGAWRLDLPEADRLCSLRLYELPSRGRPEASAPR